MEVADARGQINVKDYKEMDVELRKVTRRIFDGEAIMSIVWGKCSVLWW